MEFRVPFILASSSPRRRLLLNQVGFSFDVIPADIEETFDSSMSPPEIVRYLARAKAGRISDRHPGSLVLGADTIVVLDGDILGKPSTRDDAMEMLGRLSGRSHRVYTGIALVARHADIDVVTSTMTIVTMDELTKDTIRGYVETGQPMDKAGAYGIQDQGALLVSRLEGDFYNVMGLPLNGLYHLLRDHCQHLIIEPTSEEAHAGK